jgi:hypothetical protein
MFQSLSFFEHKVGLRFRLGFALRINWNTAYMARLIVLLAGPGRGQWTTGGGQGTTVDRMTDQNGPLARGNYLWVNDNYFGKDQHTIV